ncbi:hypothetical protein [Morganella morganii]|uniref:hypothetical protein n=1 Tax=Morganella morganii TaxID=582 RepID=UPI000469DF66|nr:hypothetical protein [Morganella morganii]
MSFGLSTSSLTLSDWKNSCGTLGVASFVARGVGTGMIAFVSAAPPVIVALVVFGIGFGLAYTFNILDEKYKVTEKLTQKLRDAQNIPEVERYWKGNH